MYKVYGFWGIIKLTLSLIYTKLFFKQARLIRLPFDIRNKRHIVIGKGFTTGIGCRLEAHPVKNSEPCLIFGNNIQINDYVHIAARSMVKIGDNVLIASKVYISDINHGCYSGNEQHDFPDTIPKDRQLSSKAIFIGDNVWIGENVCIMPGVTIGTGTVIGAGAVVTKSLPANSIAAGVPAIVIKKFNFHDQKWVTIK